MSPLSSSPPVALRRDGGSLRVAVGVRFELARELLFFEPAPFDPPELELFDVPDFEPLVRLRLADFLWAIRWPPPAAV